MQAIKTKYLAPTKRHHARVKASTGNGSGLTVTLIWQDDDTAEANHTAAAKALLLAMEAPDDTAFASGAFNEVYYHVILPTDVKVVPL